MKDVHEQFPGLCEKLKIGSIIEAKLHKSNNSNLNFTHFVVRVIKIWDEPLFPIRCTANIVQMKVVCDLSQPGRCRRDIVMQGNTTFDFFILLCKFGFEVCTSTNRLMDYLGEDMTMKGCTLECVCVIMEGGPTPFRILDTCKIIK
ncbi:hypothetical protein PENTCL1PPCAC_11469, partial [Pristionchus entomophagus]